MPQTILGAGTSELFIKKSRFLGFVEPATDRISAQRLVANIRRAHPAASHVCWALMAGGQSAAVDDGEPSGTAGRPMLDVLRFNELEGVLATVVRYYGGINLGAGGLVRAYSDAVAQALKAVDKAPIVRVRRVTCHLPYGLEGIARNRITQTDVSLVAVERAMELLFVLEGPEDQVERLMKLFNEFGHGRIAWQEP